MAPAFIGLRKWVAPAALLASSWFVLDHLLPDLLPKPTHDISLSIAALAAAVAVAAIAVRAWARLNEVLPRPWFPRPFWRIASWLKRRASVSIIAAFPKVALGNDTMDGCAFSLTVQRNLARLKSPSTLEFDRAQLVLSQTIAGKTRRFEFAPRDVGSFLASPIAAGTSDAVIVDFVGVRLPTALGEAPDFTRDFRLELRGVRVKVEGQHALAAELAAAPWPWFPRLEAGAALASPQAPRRSAAATPRPGTRPHASYLRVSASEYRDRHREADIPNRR
jgi:hypothetical protein